MSSQKPKERKARVLEISKRKMKDPVFLWKFGFPALLAFVLIWSSFLLVNGFSSVVEGLKKRPNTSYIAKISSSSLANSYIHTINRDTSERYIVVLTNGAISVYDITGTAKTVVSQTDATNYLASSDPKSDFVAITVADYTYILNKTKTAVMAATTSGAKVEQAVYSVLQGINSTKYSITIDGTTYNFTSANTDTEAIRDGLFSAMGTISGITLAKIGNKPMVNAYVSMRMIVTVVWAIYPLGYVFGYLTGGVDADSLNVIYNIADLLNKTAFGLIIWAAAMQTGGRKAK